MGLIRGGASSGADCKRQPKSVAGGLAKLRFRTQATQPQLVTSESPTLKKIYNFYNLTAILAAIAISKFVSAFVQSCGAAFAIPRTPRRCGPAIAGTASDPSIPVAFAPGRAWPELSVCKLQIVIGSRRSAANPAIPFPIGTVATICATAAGIPECATSFSTPSSTRCTVPA